MIIVKLTGGIGNQMFQCALGASIANDRSASVSYDTSGYNSYRLHNGFELCRVFNISLAIASDDDLRTVLGWRRPEIIRKLLTKHKFARLRSDRFVVEPHFHYWCEIDNVQEGCYLQGYWQSYKYFEKHESLIREIFLFKHPASVENTRIVEEINSCPSAVSLHIRRGDYVSNTKTLSVHGVCSVDYYINAVKFVCDRVVNPRFYIFSDDIEWARANIKIGFPCYFIDHNKGMESYNDMRLMSLCDHHIIANSSFSWWGAWLNQSESKIVIAPKKWFVKDVKTSDLFPKSWVVM